MLQNKKCIHFTSQQHTFCLSLCYIENHLSIQYSEWSVIQFLFVLFQNTKQSIHEHRIYSQSDSLFNDLTKFCISRYGYFAIGLYQLQRVTGCVQNYTSSHTKIMGIFKYCSKWIWKRTSLFIQFFKTKIWSFSFKYATTKKSGNIVYHFDLNYHVSMLRILSFEIFGIVIVFFWQHP